MDVAYGNSAGDIRQPFAESVTDTRPGRYQIIRSERRVNVAVSANRTRWGNRPGVISLIQPGVTSCGLETEDPLIIQLVVVTDQTAGFKSAGVQIFRAKWIQNISVERISETRSTRIGAIPRAK